MLNQFRLDQVVNVYAVPVFAFLCKGDINGRGEIKTTEKKNGTISFIKV